MTKTFKVPLTSERLEVTVGMPGCLTVVLIIPRAILTHAEVGHTAVSQDHDEFGLVGPPLLFSGCVQILCRGKEAQDEIM